MRTHSPHWNPDDEDLKRRALKQHHGDQALADEHWRRIEMLTSKYAPLIEGWDAVNQSANSRFNHVRMKLKREAKQLTRRKA